MIVSVAEAAEAIRQTEGAWPQSNAERIRKPFREKKDAGFAAMPDVSAHVQKFVRRNRFKEPFAQPATDARTHSQEGERDDADKRAALIQIDLEGNLPLQESGVGLVVDEDRPRPCGEEERLACDREQPAPPRFT